MRTLHARRVHGLAQPSMIPRLPSRNLHHLAYVHACLALMHCLTTGIYESCGYCSNGRWTGSASATRRGSAVWQVRAAASAAATVAPCQQRCAHAPLGPNLPAHTHARCAHTGYHRPAKGTQPARRGGSAEPGARGASNFTVWDIEQPRAVDGTPIDVGPALAAATYDSEARMARHLDQWKQQQQSKADHALSRLRKQYDELRMQNMQRQRAVQKVTDQLAGLESELAADAAKQSEAHGLMKHAETCDREVEVLQGKLQRAEHTRLMFEHMLERLKEESFDLKLDLADLNKRQVVCKKQGRDLQSKLQAGRTEATRSEALLKQLEMRLEASREARDAKMAQLDDALDAQVKLTKKFADRTAAGTAPGNGSGRGAEASAGALERMCHLHVVRKLYAAMLTRKLRADERRCDKLNEAFQRIRAATGLSEVEDIVSKFLSRSKIQASLSASAATSRERIDYLKREQQVLKWRLDEERVNASKVTPARVLFQAVDELHQQSAAAGKRTQEAKSRAHKLNVTVDECRASLGKMLSDVVTAEEDTPANARTLLAEFGIAETPRGGSVPSASTAVAVPADRVDEVLAALETRVARLLATVASALSDARAAADSMDDGDTEVGADADAALGTPPELAALMVALPPNMDESNMRVQPSDDLGDGSDDDADDEGAPPGHMRLVLAMAATQTGDDAEGSTGLADLVPPATVVDRASLKRLAALLQDDKKGKKLRSLTEAAAAEAEATSPTAYSSRSKANAPAASPTIRQRRGRDGRVVAAAVGAGQSA